jgi:uncharacterized protein YcbK (DUF882 family)
MNKTASTGRRLFLRQGGRLAAAALPLAVLHLKPAHALRQPDAARVLALSHTHTGERLALAYAGGEGYLPPALQALDHFLRDHYSGAVGRMDPGLYDQLHAILAALGTQRPYEVISGYRAPATNQRLQRQGAGGVATRSLHLEGRAIDVRLPGVPLAELRDAALSLRAGGVGFYPGSAFVHIDTGRVRRW